MAIEAMDHQTDRNRTQRPSSVREQTLYTSDCHHTAHGIFSAIILLKWYYTWGR